VKSIFAAVCDGPAEFERWKLQSWGLTCLAWDIDELWYVDACKGDERLGEVQFHERRLKAREIQSLEVALSGAHERGLHPVCVEGPSKVKANAVDLRAYQHRTDALYLFGSDRGAGLGSLSALAKLEADWLIVPARRGVYGYMIAPIVAQHRAQQANRLR